MVAPAVLAILVVAAISVASVLERGEVGPSPSAAATPVPDAALKQACLAGAAVGSGNDGLAGDCALLLEAKDTLRGTETLNWSAALAIASWEGITVSGSPGRVTQLHIDGWNSWRNQGRDILLRGTIPAQLGGLTKLQRLVLSRNALTGAIPAELGNLPELNTLALYNNQLTGGVPPELGGLTNLGVLELSRNQLTGAIPVELGKLSGLTSLWLHNNQLTGAVPASLGDLSNLGQLKLAGNSGLTGCIRASLRTIRTNDIASTSLTDCATTTTYALTTSAGVNGGVSPLPGTYSYLSGDSVTVTATPADGYRVASWGGDCSGTGTTCMLTMDAAKTASVTFELAVTHTLTTSSGANGSIDPSAGPHSYAQGSSVTVTATPDSGYRVASWGGDCNATTAPATMCTLTMDTARTASVTFEAGEAYTLTTSVGANGSIDLVAGTHYYDDAESVTITATPDSSYRVDAWSGDCSGTGLTCVLTMDADKTARVTFEQAYTLTTSAGANGSIDPSPGTHTYRVGESVTVTATPDSGYRVASWGGDCSGSALTCVLALDGDKTASVAFEDDTYTLTTSVGANGSVDPAPGVHTYAAGTTVTVTATPDSGYQVDEWGGDCSGSSLTCELTLDEARTASVTFGVTRTLTTSAGANGAIHPAAGAHNYADGTSVTVYSAPSKGYAVSSWGGDCSGTARTCELTLDANKTASVTFKAVVQLTVFTSGQADGEVILEWTPGAQTATRWQYRSSGPVWQGVQYRLSGTEWVAIEGQAWSAWLDVPSSTAATRSYRLSGLRAGFGYDFQVRPWTSTGAGTASAAFTQSVASLRGSDSVSIAHPATFLERGQRFCMHYTNFTFLVPQGMDLVMGRGMVYSDGTSAVNLWDGETGAYIIVDADTGADRGRGLTGTSRATGGGGSPRDATSGGRSVGALFDLIIGSMTNAPLP